MGLLGSVLCDEGPTPAAYPSPAPRGVSVPRVPHAHAASQPLRWGLVAQAPLPHHIHCTSPHTSELLPRPFCLLRLPMPHCPAVTPPCPGGSQGRCRAAALDVDMHSHPRTGSRPASRPACLPPAHPLDRQAATRCNRRTHDLLGHSIVPS